MWKKASLVAITLLFTLTLVVPASAITWGEPDGEGHPYVGMLVFADYDTDEAWRCSGTLLSPTVILTAGHCTYGADQGWVWFDADVGANAPANGYPFNGSITFTQIYTHPQYTDGAFYLHDVGIVVLESGDAQDRGTASLANVGLLDDLSTQRGLQDQLFTVVGYGLQEVVPNPNDFRADLVRYRATVKLIGTKGTAGIPQGVAALFTNNPGQGNGKGGTCSGDSGGPVFYGDSNVVAAVTSFGLNPNCVGNGGGYRIDTVDDRNFILGFLGG